MPLHGASLLMDLGEGTSLGCMEPCRSAVMLVSPHIPNSEENAKFYHQPSSLSIWFGYLVYVSGTYGSEAYASGSGLYVGMNGKTDTGQPQV